VAVSRKSIRRLGEGMSSVEAESLHRTIPGHSFMLQFRNLHWRRTESMLRGFLNLRERIYAYITTP
jgi:hypothetical protein